MKRILCVAPTLVVLAAAAIAHPPYRLQDLGDFSGGHPDGSAGAFGINGLGYPVGGADDVAGHRQAFIHRNGKLVQLPLPKSKTAVISEAYCVNNAGMVAGNVYDESLRSRAVIWTETGCQELGTLGGVESGVLDINAQGVVIGHSDTADSFSYFIWMPQAAHGFPAGMSELNHFVPRAINDAAAIAAQVRLEGNVLHSAMWLPAPNFGLPAGLTHLDSPRFPMGSRPEGMNNRGAIVGGGLVSEWEEHPALWLPSEMYGLEAGWHDLGLDDGDRVSFAWDINDRGWIVGTRTWYGDPPSEFEDPPVFIEGWLWIPGRGRIDLNDLIPQTGEYTIVYPRAINNRGEIAASAGSTALLTYRAVLLTPFCIADWNADATLNTSDFFDYLNQFFEGHADYNGDGVTNSADFFDFLNAFFEGC